jgi:hypothetical protein
MDWDFIALIALFAIAVTSPMWYLFWRAFKVASP